MKQLPKIFDPNKPLTPAELYRMAQRFGCENERIRICDGMAVSFFPRVDAVCFSKNKLIIDVSAENPIEYDELAADDRAIVYSYQGIWSFCPDPAIDFDK